MRRRPCCIGCLGLLLLAAVPLWLYVFSHDWNLWRFSRHFSKLSHPQGTRALENRRELGLLIANSNHIDYFVGQVRTFTGPRSRIRAHYLGKTVWNPIANQHDAVELMFVDEFRPDDLTKLSCPSPVVDLVERYRKSARATDRLYTIYVFDPGYPCGLDIRGC